MNLEFRRILVPLDGSTEAESALGAMMPFAQQKGVTIHLLSVVEEDQPFSAIPYLEKASRALEGQGLDVKVGTRMGRPAEEIVRYAREQNVDLIAMSTHGRAGVRRLLMGSVAEEVLRHARVPLLVRRPGPPVRPWRKVIVALDGSREAEQVLPLAAAIARTQGAALDLVRVALPVVTSTGVGEIPVVIPDEDPLPYLRTVAARLEAERIPAVPVALRGRAAAEILRHAGATAAGLICMTSHGRTGIPRALLGSIAEEVLRHAECPVLVRRILPAAVPASVTESEIRVR